MIKLRYNRILYISRDRLKRSPNIMKSKMFAFQRSFRFVFLNFLPRYFENNILQKRKFNLKRAER